MSIVIVAVALALIGLGIWLFSFAQGKERSEEVLTRLRTKEETTVLLPMMDSPELQIPGVRWASKLLWRAGSEAPPRSVALYLLAVIVLLALVVVIAGPVFGIITDLGLVILVLFVLSRRASQRRAQIIEQLPGFLENLIRILSAGNSLEESLGSAAKEAPDPIRPLFASVGRQVRLGAPVDQVLSEAGDLYGLRDLKVMALAANVNRRYGGSLRGVMKSLITAIRQRAMALRELRALTGETRFSAFILAIVPIGLTAWIYFN
ncbi:MAG: type II secretion system F family protein, partial [Nevskiales bacterium]